MALQAPEGTKDLLPDEAVYWTRFKAIATEIFGRYGYLPIETPVFEQTELFVRGIGEATDVVSKEMFTAISGENLKKLLDGGTVKAKSRLSLRPEGTAGVVRAVVQHDLVPQGAAPAKLLYAGPMFRAERPQKGRQRQFNQVGIECLGAEEPSVDAEGIIMLMRFYAAIGIPVEATRLLVNSMGCDVCRPAYRDAVKAFMDTHTDELCDECKRRAETNPLRAFDCKNPGCAAVMEGAPKITDHLCDDCREHYEAVKTYLTGAGLVFVEDPTLVRGLDYYTRTVFEVQVTEGMGSQNAIGGGGRYDKLAEEVGGRPTPGFGWALGYERCVLALEAAGHTLPAAQRCDVFVACVDDSVRAEAFSLVQALRDGGLVGEMDHQRRSLKSQFKLADKLGAHAVVVLGPDELAAGQVKVRDMQAHDEQMADLAALKTQLAACAVEGGAAALKDVLARLA
ncbi:MULTISPECIES: histidine--tRNA ligase [Gordonibacter]|uniref:Histidine--tRNA ligase n=1 Tax=Gordonibacter faecis TaxID=3047475 RepID=A0ABT7DLJ4_9ACTN|nr:MULTISPECIES: histidine--tRNA ligase [unclassified Gordonibacter]MDJ1650396.1 histidine--tRNA ligase [Gordonibacter sp. KGMB12511]HIW76759.1 histidine--tRNA ligase [Candidatus Gordonibacter avicola]